MRHEESWRHNCASGAFEWDGPTAIMTRASVKGRKRMAVLHLSRLSPQFPSAMIEDLVRRIYRDPDARNRLEAAIAATETAAPETAANPNDQPPAGPPAN